MPLQSRKHQWICHDVCFGCLWWGWSWALLHFTSTKWKIINTRISLISFSYKQWYIRTFFFKIFHEIYHGFINVSAYNWCMNQYIKLRASLLAVGKVGWERKKEENHECYQLRKIPLPSQQPFFSGNSGKEPDYWKSTGELNGVKNGLLIRVIILSQLCCWMIWWSLQVYSSGR